VGKGWAVFFGVVLTATFLIWLAAPAMGWWLPDNIASFGGEVDGLFFIILWLTGFFFVLTEALLVYCMWKYAYRPGAKADYVEGNNRLEILWTAVPAGILLFIAIAQIGAWERIKYATRMPPPNQVIQVTARQWEWRLRYPANPDRFNADIAGKDPKEVAADARRWAEVPEADDLYLPNELHTWLAHPDSAKKEDRGAKLKIFLKTVDVLHSFGIPNFRVMQDALPGKTIPMWLAANEHNTEKVGGAWTIPDPKKAWELACKELCGNGHYRMRGLVYVHKDYNDYKEWLQEQLKQQRSHDEKATATTGGQP
jgi:cytochrome c oxidase subunit 2